MSTPSGSFTNLSGNPGMGGGMNMGNMGNSGAMTPQQVQQAAQSLSTSESLLGHILLMVYSVLGDTLWPVSKLSGLPTSVHTWLMICLTQSESKVFPNILLCDSDIWCWMHSMAYLGYCERAGYLRI